MTTLPDLLLRTGAMEGPYKLTKPRRVGLLTRISNGWSDVLIRLAALECAINFAYERGQHEYRYQVHIRRGGNPDDIFPIPF